MKKSEHIDKYKYPQHFTETERISKLSSLQLIEVSPGWYIENIPSSKWWFLQDNPEIGEQLIAKAGITNNPFNAQDFTDLYEYVAGVLKSFQSAKLVTLDVSLKQH
jgi:hypothetical protein